MSDARDDQDQAEALDDDNLDPGDFPPDRSIELGEFADVPDSVGSRSMREEPDLDPRAPSATERETVAGLLEPDLVDGEDVEGELIAEEAEADDDAGGVVLSDATDSRADPANRPAEEAALHVERT